MMHYCECGKAMYKAQSTEYGRCGCCVLGLDESQERHYKTHQRAVALDRQEGGNHYKTKGIQPVEYIFANNIGFCEGNIIKYVTRWKDKGGVEDLKKARHYLDLLIENEEAPN